MKIALDVMGYENDISEAIIAARKFVKKYHDVKIILVGDKDKINPLIQEGEFEVFHASEVLTMEESALTALRRTNTSMFQAIKLVADNKADGVLSAGSTVGFISLSYFILKSIPGISKPAFMPYMPTVNKKGVMLIDVGANKTCTGEDLHQFAIMADIYCKTVRGIESPKIGVINIGTEAQKGFEYHHVANELLKKNNKLNYQGFVEPRYILQGVVDICVSDGYTGNLVLKAIEGGLKSLTSSLKQSFKKPWNWLGALFSIGSILSLKKTFDYRNNAGAIVIGLNKPAVKTHGSADMKQFYSSLEMLKKVIDVNLVKKIKENINKYDK